MWICPVCKTSTDTPFCPRCGFDRSIDRTAFPTLGKTGNAADLFALLRQERAGLLTCPVCGSVAFSCELSGGGLRCRCCGHTHASPQPQKHITAIAAGDRHTAVLYSDGTVRAVGKNNCCQCNTDHWTDITAISAGFQKTIGLRRDGTAVAVGNNSCGMSQVHRLKDIRQIEAGFGTFTVCLHNDGSVTTIGESAFSQSDADNWLLVTRIFVGVNHVIGFNRFGHPYVGGSNKYSECDIDSWPSVTDIAAGGWHTLGLLPDGTVRATGYNEQGQCNVEHWRDIVSIQCGEYYSAGLKRDGTVVIAGDTGCIRNAEGWTDIVAISGGSLHLVGLRSDGVLLAAGANDDGQCNVHALSR